MPNKISSWNSDKGFGFVTVEGERCFLHVTALSPRPARGADLNGREISGIRIEQGDRGPKVVSATLVPSEEEAASEAARRSFIYVLAYEANRLVAIPCATRAVADAIAADVKNGFGAEVVEREERSTFSPPRGRLERRLRHLVASTSRGVVTGVWTDYGRSIIR